MICSGFERIALKNWAICSKKTYLYVLTVFHSFPELFLSPLFMSLKEQMAPNALRSVALFYISTGSICSPPSLQKNDRERIPLSITKNERIPNPGFFSWRSIVLRFLLSRYTYFFLFRKFTQYCAIRAFANFTRAPSLLPILPRIFFLNQPNHPSPSYWLTSVCVGGERDFSCLWLAKEYKMDGQRVFVLR